MLLDKQKATIRKWYATLQEQHPGFKKRPAQAALIAEIAKCISGELDKKRRVLLAEAGTGTGKSLAYLLSAIPIAQQLNKTVVISTATVALQQQLVEKDLPMIHRAAEGKFRFALVKGRSRYCCQHKLRQRVLSPQGLKASQLEMAKQLLDALQKAKWKGDRDSWPKTIPLSLWKDIEADSLSCSPQFAHHRNCPFNKARLGLKKVDVLVVNHALLLSDLMAGGGHVIPPPEQCVFILDEAHQFPEITRAASQSQLSLKAASAELDAFRELDKQLAANLTQNSVASTSLKLREAASELQRAFAQLGDLARQNLSSFNNSGHWRLSSKNFPAAMSNLVENYRKDAVKLSNALSSYASYVQEAVKDGQLKQAVAEQKLSQLDYAHKVSESWCELFYDYQQAGQRSSHAYWLSKTTKDYSLNASPIEVGAKLQQLIWEEAYAVIAVSATMSALGRFDYFLNQAGFNGLPAKQLLKLPSPFDYQQVELAVPSTISEPDAPSFPSEVAEHVLQATKRNSACLLLCNSYRLMDMVVDALPADVASQVLVQGSMSNQALLAKHAKKVKRSDGSIIIATMGFSEGVDLPGDLLTELIIARLPFAIPTDPVWESHAEILEQKNLNPFMLLTLPNASRKLVQSCGRLMRKETDSGRIVLLDKRLTSRRYGQQLLAALPPYKRSDR